MGGNYSKSKPKYGYLYPLRPSGQICIVNNIEYNYINVYGVIILTGKDRGKTTFVRLRDMVLTKGRKPEKEDINKGINGRYKIAELWQEIDNVILL